MLGPLLLKHSPGDPLFEGITAADALARLRAILVVLNVPNAADYRTHDFRRGHAKDLQLSGVIFHVTCMHPAVSKGFHTAFARGTAVGDTGCRGVDISRIPEILGPPSLGSRYGDSSPRG